MLLAERLIYFKKRGSTLGWLAGATVLVAAIPLLFVIDSSLQLSYSQWQNLWSTRLPGLLWNTLSLAVLVAIACFALGVSSAWLVARRAFVGRRLATWLMVMPLAIPTYVFASIYTSLMESDGWLGQAWHSLFGPSVAIPDLYNVIGVALVLSLSGFSYVFLLVRAALSQSSQGIEDAARIQGASPVEIFLRVNLPMLRPAIAASLALVVLHVLSDFGAVSILRYQTFTMSIYLQMIGRFDFQAAAGLSLVLVLLSATFLVMERLSRHRQRYYAGMQTRPAQVKHASWGEQVVIWLWLGLIALLAFVLPLAWMINWSIDAMARGAISPQFWGYVGNSISVAAMAATIAMVVALPIGLYHTRKRSLTSHTLLQFSSIGFVLPGPVVALGVVMFLLSQLPLLYGGLTALLMALVVRFLPLAVQSQEASMQQLTPAIEEAGRVLGASPLVNLWRITLPMIRGGMTSAWVLVFIDTLKELPATLILRPIGFDTLPVRIWIESSEEMLEMAAPAALMLVIGTLPALWLLMGSELKNGKR